MIVKPSALGDVVHSLPFLDAIHRRFPEAAIDWVVARNFSQLLDGHPMIRRLWIIDKDSWKKPSHFRGTVGSLADLFQSLRREKYDLVVDLQGLLRSGVISLAAGTAVRVGFAEAREGSSLCYTHRIRGGRDVHAVDRYLRVAAFLGCEPGKPLFSFPNADPAGSSSSVLGPISGDYAVIAPSAGGLAKRWIPERFGEVAARLSMPSLVVAAAPDEELARRVVSASNGRAVSLAGKTSLKELIGIIGRAAFLLSPDTGPMHIAAALGIPVFALFGPTSPDRTGPYGERSTIITAGLSCSPCYRRKPCKDWKCMSTITPSQVLGAIDEKRIGL